MTFPTEPTRNLNYYYKLVKETILQYQNPITGLISPHDNDHAGIRDNLYSIICIWALSLSFKKTCDVEEDRAKYFELQQATVKCMRGLLLSMMRQSDKIEKFQLSCSVKDSIHAKFSAKDGHPVVGDNDWGHLQIDAISLYLLTLTQITTSGVQVIFTLEEVSVIQNLVFYIETAYCIPDFGIWSRGDKTNKGITELNVSSIGMAKAALEAMTELDLFGANGGSVSVIHVMSDETRKNNAILMSMLPRESLSKETDSSLLTVIGYPSFAVESSTIIKQTMDTIVSKLGGRYGFKRFIRDGYKTPIEDPNRLHYESWELQVFEQIECQWPLFFCYMVINGYFHNDEKSAIYYSDLLEEMLITNDKGFKLVPELYAVPNENLDAERANPGSQNRKVGGAVPFLWAQSLYILSRLLREKYIVHGEIDPINRRRKEQSSLDSIVQVVVLTRDANIQSSLRQHGIIVQTHDEVAPYEVHSSNVLAHLFKFLGKNEKLGFKGRKKKTIGLLDTSKFYRIQNKLCSFTPERLDFARNYIDSDTNLMMITLEYTLSYLSSSWSSTGRPLLTLSLGSNILENDVIPTSVIRTLRKLNSGMFVNGTRVKLGSFEDFLSTSCICNLDFVGYSEYGYNESIDERLQKYLNNKAIGPINSSIFKKKFLRADKKKEKTEFLSRKQSMKGTIRRSRSIVASPEIDGMKKRWSVQRVDSTDETGNISLDEEFDDFPHRTVSFSRRRLISETNFESADIDSLLSQLAQAENLAEEGDILHYLASTIGLNYETEIFENGKNVKIKDLLNSLYDNAIAKRNWGIVRHSAGLLGKRFEDLSKNVTDILVRQKQVTIGLPPLDEITISRPLTNNELRKLMFKAFKGDASTAMLANELLCYLAMFINTDPHIFHGIMRIRIGLIIQVLASEMGDKLDLSKDDAYEQLMSLSPFDMRNILLNVMASKDFHIDKIESGWSINTLDETKLSQALLKSSFKEEYKEKLIKANQNGQTTNNSVDSDDTDDNDEEEGAWVRRRRLDGALNRVPTGFYSKIWHLLRVCRELHIGTEKYLSTSVTQEMTSEELNFALAVEQFLNFVSYPEYRQLLVEVLMVLIMAQERRITKSLDDSIDLDKIVHLANELFLIDQRKIQGDAMQCCAKEDQNHDAPLCGGAGKICQIFYDTAPSGPYGTMQYMIHAACQLLDQIPKDGEISCNVM
ncbi:probable phosphorylase b kinase regulatory subunit alpha isoform X2 [Lepeophtheirus salmonis]|uniref:probable phosphorylase b kinase regulatory subunit alpha isoform X2 n=1 Tax=Lepeophtheirus salmonis TaxID=72036 RepID=UPI001AE6C348|nr:probable phosphorylase b kinase regulatory subunit alpha isoform X2 [Lepeophtheirus salmonis]